MTPGNAFNLHFALHATIRSDAATRLMKFLFTKDMDNMKSRR